MKPFQITLKNKNHEKNIIYYSLLVVYKLFTRTNDYL